MVGSSFAFESGTAVAFLLDASIKGSVVALTGASLTVILRRHSAAWRHTIWTTVVAAQVILPALSFVLPRWRVLPATLTPGSALTEMLAAVSGAASHSLTLAGPPVQMPLSGPAESAAPAGSDIAMVIWSIGALFFLMRLAGAHVRVVRQRRRARPVAATEWKVLLCQIAQESGVKRMPELLESPDIVIPVVCGTSRCAILLPVGAASWPETRREAVLLHEMAHIRRYDLVVEHVVSAAGILFWFNPLVRMSVAFLRLECERACDDAVLCAGVIPTSYVRELVSLLRTARRAPFTAAASVGLFSTSHIETRMLALLDPRLPRLESSRGVRSAAVVALLVVAPLLAAASPRARGIPASTTPVQPARNSLNVTGITREDEASRLVRQAPPAWRSQREIKAEYPRSRRLVGVSRLLRPIRASGPFALNGDRNLTGPGQLDGPAQLQKHDNQ
jgi:beta-lactamase regulating signal transducer with metallopeptidase domain